MYLSLAKAKELVEQAIVEKGEGYVYPDLNFCVNVESRQTGEDEVEYFPSCIVGYAMVNAGIPAKDIHEFDLVEDGALSLISRLKGLGVIEGYDDDAVSFLMAIQLSQDNQRPWGEARTHALAGEAWSVGLQTYVPYDPNLT